MSAHLSTALVAEPAELFADAARRVDVILGVPQAAADGQGMTLVWQQTQTARDDVRPGRRRIDCGHIHDH